jgi:hypothetical protein
MSRVLFAVASAFLLLFALSLPPANATTTTIVVPGTEAPAWMGGTPTPPDDPANGVKYVHYDRSLWPLTGSKTLDKSVSGGVVILLATIQDTPGPKVARCTSQGALVCSEVRRQYDANPSTAPPPSELSFVYIADPATPNGGLLSRFTLFGGIPILGIKFYPPTPNDGYPTLSIHNQYDGFSDSPAYPINLVADVNAIMGIAYLHSDESGYRDYLANPNDPKFVVSTVGNTTYVMVKKPLPLLMPLRQVGLTPVADALEGPLRTVVELGYDRQDSPGTPVPARLFPPLSTVVSQLPKLPVLPKLPSLPKPPVAMKMPKLTPPDLKQLLPKVPAFKPGDIVKSIPNRSHNLPVGSLHLPAFHPVHIPHPAADKGKGGHDNK